MAIRIKDFASIIPPELRRWIDDADALDVAIVDAKTIDADNRRLTFVASDDSVDLDDEIVAAGAFHEMRDTYLRNPVILAQHQHRLASGLSPVIGKAMELTTDRSPLLVRMQFAGDDAGEIVRNHWSLYRDGFQRAFSVGFRALDVGKINNRRAITKGQLLEISAVPVPANSNALVLSHLATRLGWTAEAAPDAGLAAELMRAVRELTARIANLETHLSSQTNLIETGSLDRAEAADATGSADDDSTAGEADEVDMQQVRDCLAAVDKSLAR